MFSLVTLDWSDSLVIQGARDFSSLTSNYVEKHVHKEEHMLSFLLTDLSFFLVDGRNDDECIKGFSSAPFTVN